MKTIKDYIDECGEAPAGGFGPGMATPGNTMGMGNPDGTEVPTAKAKVEKPKKRRKKKEVKESETVNEFAMKFNKKKFFAEFFEVMEKYKVKIVSDVEGTYIEDQYGNMILDLTDKFLTPEEIKKIAIEAK